jgi:DNA-damage-inducible protein D
MADDPPKSAKIAIKAFQEALRKLSSPENRENAIKTNATIKDGAIERLIADFEDASQIDFDGNEYWDARDLAGLLEYSDYRNFLNIVDKAKEACSTTGIPVVDHFVDATEMVDIGSGAVR